MQRLIQNCNRIHNNYHAIANVYKNVTYIGSISCSFIIYMLLFFFNQCGSNVHNTIHHLALFKSFLLLVINNKNNEKKDNNIYTLRYYGIGAQIIKDLKVRNMILISRSKKKIIGLEGFGIKIKKQIIIK